MKTKEIISEIIGSLLLLMIIWICFGLVVVTEPEETRGSCYHDFGYEFVSKLLTERK